MIRLFMRDTKMSYRELSDLLNRSLGPAGPDTWWVNSAHIENMGFVGFVEIYDIDNPGATFVALSWS